MNARHELSLLQSPDETKAVAAVQEAFKSGVNFFDIAPFYASGDAERVRDSVLQRLLAQSTLLPPSTLSVHASHVYDVCSF